MEKTEKKCNYTFTNGHNYTAILQNETHITSSAKGGINENQYGLELTKFLHVNKYCWRVNKLEEI